MKKIQHTLALTLMTLALISSPCSAGLESFLRTLAPYLNEQGKTILEIVLQGSGDINTVTLPRPRHQSKVERAVRNTVFTAFKYHAKVDALYAPRMNTGEEVESRLRDDSRFTNNLSQFEKIIGEKTGLYANTQDKKDRWDFVTSVVTLENAVYPGDRPMARKDIDENLKQEIAWEILTKCGLEYVNPTSVLVDHVEDFWKIPKRVPLQQEGVQQFQNPRVLQPCKESSSLQSQPVEKLILDSPRDSSSESELKLHIAGEGEGVRGSIPFMMIHKVPKPERQGEEDN